MALFKEKSTANAGVLARIFDEEDSHFGPTHGATPASSLSSLNSHSLAASQVVRFRLNREEAGVVKTYE